MRFRNNPFLRFVAYLHGAKKSSFDLLRSVGLTDRRATNGNDRTETDERKEWTDRRTTKQPFSLVNHGNK